jgi:hypothetical protein
MTGMGRWPLVAARAKWEDVALFFDHVVLRNRVKPANQCDGIGCLSDLQGMFHFGCYLQCLGVLGEHLCRRSGKLRQEPAEELVFLQVMVGHGAVRKAESLHEIVGVKVENEII